MSTRLSLLAPLALSLLAFGPPAAADADRPPADGPAGVEVRTDDLNLRTEVGARLLMDRIRRAAMVACGGPPEVRLSASTARYRACVTLAANRAAVEAVLELRRPNPRITVLADAAR